MTAGTAGTTEANADVPAAEPRQELPLVRPQSTASKGGDAPAKPEGEDSSDLPVAIVRDASPGTAETAPPIDLPLAVPQQDVVARSVSGAVETDQGEVLVARTAAGAPVAPGFSSTSLPGSPGHGAAALEREEPSLPVVRPIERLISRTPARPSVQPVRLQPPSDRPATPMLHLAARAAAPSTATQAAVRQAPARASGLPARAAAQLSPAGSQPRSLFRRIFESGAKAPTVGGLGASSPETAAQPVSAAQTPVFRAAEELEHDALPFAAEVTTDVAAQPIVQAASAAPRRQAAGPQIARLAAGPGGQGVLPRFATTIGPSQPALASRAEGARPFSGSGLLPVANVTSASREPASESSFDGGARVQRAALPLFREPAAADPGAQALPHPPDVDGVGTVMRSEAATTGDAAGGSGDSEDKGGVDFDKVKAELLSTLRTELRVERERSRGWS